MSNRKKLTVIPAPELKTLPWEGLAGAPFLTLDLVRLLLPPLPPPPMPPVAEKTDVEDAIDMIMSDYDGSRPMRIPAEAPENVPARPPVKTHLLVAFEEEAAKALTAKYGCEHPAEFRVATADGHEFCTNCMSPVF